MLTEAAGTPRSLRAATGGDAVVVFGGDGAVNEVLNGLGRASPSVRSPVAVRACSRALSGFLATLSAAAERVADAIAAARTRRITLGRVDGRRFGFAAGARLRRSDRRAVDALGRGTDGRRPGDLAFAYELVRLLRPGASRRAGARGAGRGRAAAVFVANCDPYTYAGAIPLHIAPDARFELGLDLVAPVRIAARTLPRLARSS